MNFFYDKQIRRHLIQFVRMFSNFSVQIGENDDGDPIFRTVPAKYGDPTRMAAAIMRENSENTMLSVPQITCYITGMTQSRERIIHQGFTRTDPIFEKQFNDATGEYSNEEGNAYSLTRKGPVPYDLDIAVDVWCSNTDQKLQLLEQLLVLFDPAIDLRSSRNPFDWSALSYNELTNIQFSSRSQPVGTEDVIDIATLTFRSMINLTPPARFNRSKLIHTILTKLYTMSDTEIEKFAAGNSFSHDSLSYHVVTPSQYWLDVVGTKAQIQTPQGTSVDKDGNTLDWKKILGPIGDINDGYSQVRLRLAGTPDDDDSDVIGTIAYDPGDTTKLDITIDTDTLPATTQSNVLARVNPQANYPGDGTLAAATTGQRYVLTQSTQGTGWGTLSADAGDIVEYDGSNWNISFDASASSGAHYITDDGTSELLYYGTNGWGNAYQQRYKPGFWRIYI